MPDYKASDVAGHSWVRCNMISIFNPSDGAPSYSFQEEKIIEIAEEKIVQSFGSLYGTFNPANVVPVVDIVTLLPTGETFTELELYTMLFSKYMALANVRDNPPITE
jgi:hypothetical protein